MLKPLLKQSKVRDRVISRRTGVINQLRALLLERGVTFRKGRRYLRRQMPLILEDAEQNLASRMRRLLEQLWQEWKSLEEQIQRLSDEIESIAQQDAACQRLLAVPGVGSLVATALVASVGDGTAFRKGREFAAWLGLVPRQFSTGGKTKLLGISKRGNPYLRRLFIHGARSVAMHLNRDEHSLGTWMNQLESRAHHNVFLSLRSPTSWPGLPGLF
jgi:transposase